MNRALKVSFSRARSAASLLPGVRFFRGEPGQEFEFHAQVIHRQHAGMGESLAATPGIVTAGAVEIGDRIGPLRVQVPAFVHQGGFVGGGGEHEEVREVDPEYLEGLFGDLESFGEEERVVLSQEAGEFRVERVEHRPRLHPVELRAEPRLLGVFRG